MEVCCVCGGVGEGGVEDVSAKLARVLEIEVTRSTQVNHPIPLCTPCADDLNEFTRLFFLTQRAQLKIVNPILQSIPNGDIAAKPIAIWKRSILTKWMEKYNQAQRLVMLNGGEGEQISHLDLTRMSNDLDLSTASFVKPAGGVEDETQLIGNEDCIHSGDEGMEVDGGCHGMNGSVSGGEGSGAEEVTVLGDEEIHEQTTLQLTHAHHTNPQGNLSHSLSASGGIAKRRWRPPIDSKNLHPPFICVACGRFFSKKGTLRMHRSRGVCKGEEEGNAKICFCGEDFGGWDWLALKSHIDEVHPQTQLKRCRLCNKEVLSESMRHECTATASRDPVSQHNCDYCQSIFKARGSLHWHLRSKHGDESRKFPCQFCSMAFNSTSGRDKHIVATHNTANPTPFQCTHCSVYLSTATYLKTHLRIHAGDKEFSCQICQMKFTRRDHLNQHKAVHSEQKNFACDACDKAYKRRFNLRQHHKLMHGIFQLYKCLLCPHRRFNKPSTLKAHMEVDHPGTPAEDILAQLDGAEINKENRPKKSSCTKRKIIGRQRCGEWSDSESESASEAPDSDESGLSEGDEFPCAQNEGGSGGAVNPQSSPGICKAVPLAAKSSDQDGASGNNRMRGRLFLVGSPVNY